jgi:methenyltetrahydromethanopterin cyclohydrolase
MSKISLNSSTLKLVDIFCREAEKYAVSVEKTESGATLIDAGIESNGGFLAGGMVTEICLGGYGEAKILPVQYADIVLPSVYVQTDYPALSTLGSQFAGWQIKATGFSAIGSGPARALALKPKKLYEKLGYKDEADSTVLVLETDKKPPEEAILQIAEKCGVSTENLFLVVFSTSSLTGSTQVSGRIMHGVMRQLFPYIRARARLWEGQMMQFCMEETQITSSAMMMIKNWRKLLSRLPRQAQK